jgi:tetratricopeptide (TPR) repeat protein
MPSEEKYEQVAALIKDQNFDKAQELLVPLLDAEPENIGLLLDAGYVYANLEKMDRSKHYYQKVVELAPQNPAGYTGLGFITEDSQKRIHWFQKALKYSPRNALVYYEMGNAYLERDQYQKALDAYLKSLQFGSKETEPETLISIAQTYLGLEKWEKAVETCKNILEKYPEIKGAYYIMASAESVQENYSQALEYLEKYIKSNPHDKNAQKMKKNLKKKIV